MISPIVLSTWLREPEAQSAANGAPRSTDAESTAECWLPGSPCGSRAGPWGGCPLVLAVSQISSLSLGHVSTLGLISLSARGKYLCKRLLGSHKLYVLSFCMALCFGFKYLRYLLPVWCFMIYKALSHACLIWSSQPCYEIGRTEIILPILEIKKLRIKEVR